jgi:hypothetical protein
VENARGNGEKILIANISGTIKKQFAALDFYVVCEGAGDLQSRKND